MLPLLPLLALFMPAEPGGELGPANVNLRLRQQQAVGRGGAGLHPLAQLLRTSPAGACMPRAGDVPGSADAPGGRLRALLPSSTPFYLDEGPGLEMHAVHACLDALLAKMSAGASVRFDDIMPPNKAAYLSDLLILRALRSHPQRVLTPSQAALHFTGLTPHASLVANYSCLLATGETHETRMQRATDALRMTVEQTAERRLYVIMHPSWNWRALGVSLRALLAQHARSGRFVLATGDRTYAAHVSKIHAREAVIIPYLPSERLALCDEVAPMKLRELSVYFTGNMHRQRGEGRVRFQAIEGIARGTQRGKFVDRVFRRQSEHRLSYATMAQDCAREMSASRFCLAPAGDVPTSRRIPDAMAAGCIPVHVGEFEAMRSNLPFPNHIDWGSSALFAGSVDCLSRANTSTALGGVLEAIHPTLLSEASAHVRSTFTRQLSFYPGGGAPSALLQELYISFKDRLGLGHEVK
mmetsp:Transcript_16479/g.41375  ORF Transcript_16479/g.41375 Transcript_16479/m.41375 type:complete len:468 (+) Transcript_16479:326-1729(+)